MEGVLGLIVLVCAILQIVLFAKVWRMCDDVHNIANKYLHNIRILSKQERDKIIKGGKSTPETKEVTYDWHSGKIKEKDE